MPDAVHFDDTNFIGVTEDYKTYSGPEGRPYEGQDDSGVRARVKALETYRKIGVPYLGYSYSKVHPATAKFPWDDRAALDQKVIIAAGITAQDVIDAP